MNTQRYIACGVVSVALHSLAISAQTPAPQFAINDANSGQTVAIQFIARAAEPEKAPEPSVAPQPQNVPLPAEVEPEETPAPTPSPVEVKKEAADMAPVAPPKPRVDKPERKRPEKVKREEKAKPPREKPKPVVEKVAKPEPEKVPEKKPAPADATKKAPQPDSSAAVSTAAASPLLVEKPAFKVRPSPPNYPRKAKRRGMEGTVLLEVWLDENGKQIRQTLLQSSGHNVLDEAALKAVRQWQFNQHTVNGVALAHRVRIPVRFNLD